MSPRSSSSTWMCPPCHQLTPHTSSASAEWMTSCSGLQGRERGRAGLSSFPSSGSDGIGGLFSAPQDRGAVQLQHHSSAAPGKTSPSTASQGEKWGGLNLGGGGGQQSLQGVSGWLYSPWRTLQRREPWPQVGGEQTAWGAQRHGVGQPSLLLASWALSCIPS